MLRKKLKQTNKQTKQNKTKKQIIATAFLSLRKKSAFLIHAEQNHFQGHGVGNLVCPEFGTYEKSQGTESRNYARIKLINYSLLSRTFPKHPSISRVVNIPQTEIYLEETPLGKWNFTVTGKIAQMRDFPSVFV